MTRSGQRSLEPAEAASTPRLRFRGADPSALAMNMSQSPSRSLAKARRQPSGDQAGSLSSAVWLVKLTGAFEGSREAPIPRVKISEFPVPPETKASRSPEPVMAGDSSLPESVVNLETCPVSSLRRYTSKPPFSIPSRVFRSEVNASTRLLDREGSPSWAAFRVRFVRLEPSGCIE